MWSPTNKSYTGMQCKWEALVENLGDTELLLNLFLVVPSNFNKFCSKLECLPLGPGQTLT